MSATIPASIAMEAVLIMAGKALVLAVPVLIVAALWWLANRVDMIIARLFPHLQWEKELGWLNIGAERRAKTALRWLGAALYLALAAALVGIAWETRQIVDDLAGWPDWPVIGRVMIRLSLLSLDLSVWLMFLGGWLIPKIRADRENAELREFRTEMEAWERARERQPRRHPQLVSQYKKPRTDSIESILRSQPGRLRRPLGE